VIVLVVMLSDQVELMAASVLGIVSETDSVGANANPLPDLT
jgi:hypothetical protein